MQLVSVDQEQATARAEHTSPLALWHLLSLDAPTVAALWTLFIAHCAGLTLPSNGPAAMFIAVWMLYAADRLLDARPLHNGAMPPDLEERHRFHHRHRTAFLTTIAVASGILAVLLDRLNPRALHLYALLATLLAAWLLLIHARGEPQQSRVPRSSRSTSRDEREPQPSRLPKELAVGIFFPAAIFIPTVARAPQLQPALLPAAALLAAVCTLNCLFLYAWEHPAPRTQAHWTTRWATHHLTALTLTVIAAATLTAVLSRAQILPPLDLAPAAACALSAALLITLDRQRTRLTTITARASADLVLLTPLLCFTLR